VGVLTLLALTEAVAVSDALGLAVLEALGDEVPLADAEADRGAWEALVERVPAGVDVLELETGNAALLAVLEAVRPALAEAEAVAAALDERLDVGVGGA
jgi:hypothetical protein